MDDKKHIVLLLGKIPPPYFGPSIASSIILGSSLKRKYDLLFLDVKVNRSIADFGKTNLKKLLQNIKHYLSLTRILRNKKPEVVIIPISQGTIGFLKDSVFIVISALYRRKVLIQLRGSNLQTWLIGSGKMVRRYVRFVFNLATGAIVLGSNLRFLFSDYFPEEKIFVVPNGANYQFPSIKKSNHKIEILYFGNLLESKGVANVIDAVASFKNFNSINVTMAGAWYDDIFRFACEKRIEDLHLPIEVFGPTEGQEKLNLYAKAHIFVFPPIAPEGHPWVIIEAMAAGLPIITTDKGAIKESVQDGRNGFIVSSNNPGQIFEKLQLLVNDSQLRTEMGRQSLKLYHENLTEEKMVNNLAGAIEGILAS